MRTFGDILEPSTEKKWKLNRLEKNEGVFFGPVWISNKNKRIIQREIIKWGKKNYIDFPWRNTNNAYHALIAEIMLQRTRAEQVVPIYYSFTKNYESFYDVANEDPNKILSLLEPLGLVWRAKNIIALSKSISLLE